MTDLISRVKAARNASVPLLALTTSEPAACIRSVRDGLGNGGDGKAPLPIFVWDAVRGLKPINPAGVEALREVGTEGEELESSTTLCSDCLAFAVKLPGERQSDDGQTVLRGSILFMMNSHRYLNSAVQGSAMVAQAVWNLRDEFKQNRRTLILLAPQLQLPQELQQDVIVLDDPLPDEKALGDIIEKQISDAGLAPLESDSHMLAIDAVRGLSAFTAEQVTAMSINFDSNVLDLESLWERKRAAIEQTQGLSVSRSREDQSAAGGLEQAWKFGLSVLRGNARPRVIVHWEEVEKSFGGVANQGGAGDNTGVSQDALGVWLTKMEENDWTGMLCVGPPGAGKTLFARTLGNSVDPRIETIMIDSGSMKASLVGASEALIRGAVKTLEAVAGKGGAMFIGTCNSLDALPDALRRRFRMGIWYFDLPTQEERKAIWVVNLKRFGLTPTMKDMPSDEDWTGADIRNACEMAWRLNTTPREAAIYIVPVAKSNPEGVDKLRRQAHGRYLSASKPGYYEMKSKFLTDTAEKTGQILSRVVKKEA